MKKQIRWVNTYSKIVGDGWAVGTHGKHGRIWIVTSYPWIYILAGEIIEDEGTPGYASTRGTNPQRAFLGKILDKKLMTDEVMDAIMWNSMGVLDRHGTVLLPELVRRYNAN